MITRARLAISARACSRGGFWAAGVLTGISLGVALMELLLR